MNEEKKDFSTSVADEVEKSVKEKSAKAENFVRNALDSFEEFIYQLVAIRPKEYRPRGLKKVKSLRKKGKRTKRTKRRNGSKRK